MSVELLLTSVLLGAGLAMDAFSVSIANGLADSSMEKKRMFEIAGTFAGFQFLMPMAGWFCVTRAAEKFEWFRPMIPWIALVLLLIIGGGLLKDGVAELKKGGGGKLQRGVTDDLQSGRSGEDRAGRKETGSAGSCSTNSESGAKLTFASLMMQGVATSIDALSVGFTTSAYHVSQALMSSLIIGLVTLVICMAGLRIGRRLGEYLAGRASILGGLILVCIGLEIWIKGVFF